MCDGLIRAHLNLYAVLQNLENLVKLDPEMAEFSKDWRISIQFAVRRGPAAYVEFHEGACRHGRGAHPNPGIRLFFLSPKHLNDMFEGHGTPIPLKGFTKLGFLQKKFTKLTERLEYYLKPEQNRLSDPDYLKTNTTLTLYTAVHAVTELALLEPTSREIAAATPNGTLQIGVLHGGPYAHLVFDQGAVTARKGQAERPSATMSFRTMQVANDLLGGRLDAFQAVALGDVQLRGLLPMIDNAGLILDRVGMYLS